MYFFHTRAPPAGENIGRISWGIHSLFEINAGRLSPANSWTLYAYRYVPAADKGARPAQRSNLVLLKAATSRQVAGRSQPAS
jgi:hypothetical protein